ncbi:serine/threonine-protein kinase [Nonomuraea sp. NPDC049269]|uniref:serine/threonine-protein kinase n=1 Tax=Nonomuraea sp. NPDC049269 TaxID=3364349 RepID=UPI00371847D3
MDGQQRVGPYTLVRKLGEGGMGFVYLATEYVEGPDLSGVVARQGPLTGSNLEALAVGVATALAAIHQAGVVHRDLKPSNVLLSSVGPRVIDFGIAQLADTGGAPVTIAQHMGTPAYMSPEQAKGEQVTSASDIFSWAALVTYAGIGSPPFGTGGVAEVVYRVINHAPVLTGLDERIRPLVERALDKDPERRPSAQQLLDRLLGRAEVPVDAATRLVTDNWTPIVPTPPASPTPAVTPAAVTPAATPAPAPAATPDLPGSSGSPGLSGSSGPAGGTRAVRRGWKGPLAGAVLAAVLGVAATLAVLRPWQERSAEPNTPAVTRTVDALSTTFQVRIDSLVRQGGTARLQWTVKNVGKQNAPLYDRFGGDTFDNTVSKVSIVPPGVGKPIYPARKDNACQCADVPKAAFEGGMQLQLWAVFEGLPEDAEHVDVNLGPLGMIKNVALSSA